MPGLDPSPGQGPSYARDTRPHRRFRAVGPIVDRREWRRHDSLAPGGASPPTEKGPEAYRTIREVADFDGSAAACAALLGDAFSANPTAEAGRRPALLPPRGHRAAEAHPRLLYDEGYTIKGVQKLFKEQGVQALSIAGEPAPAADVAMGVRPNVASKVAEDDLAALRAALAEIVDAERILAQVRSPGLVKQRAAVAALRPADALTIRAASECSAARLAH